MKPRDQLKIFEEAFQYGEWIEIDSPHSFGFFVGDDEPTIVITREIDGWDAITIASPEVGHGRDPYSALVSVLSQSVDEYDTKLMKLKALLASAVIAKASAECREKK